MSFKVIFGGNQSIAEVQSMIGGNWSPQGGGATPRTANQIALDNAGLVFNNGMPSIKRAVAPDSNARCYDGHFWIEKDGEILNDFTGEKICKIFEARGQIPYYQKIEGAQSEAFILEAKAICVAKWKDRYGVSSDAEAIAEWLKYNDIDDFDGFSCVQNMVIQHHIHGGKVYWGFLGAIEEGQGKIHWWFGHPNNKREHWVKMGAEGDARAEKIQLNNEGRSAPTRLSVDKPAKKYLKAWKEGKIKFKFIRPEVEEADVEREVPEGVYPRIDGHFWVERDGAVVDFDFPSYLQCKEFWKCSPSAKPQYLPAPSKAEEDALWVFEACIRRRYKMLPDEHSWDEVCKRCLQRWPSPVSNECYQNAVAEIGRNGGKLRFGSMGWEKRAGGVHWEFGGEGAKWAKFSQFRKDL